MFSFLGRGAKIWVFTGFMEALGSISEDTIMILVLDRFEEAAKS
jgi:hypothetical protein